VTEIIFLLLKASYMVMSGTHRSLLATFVH